MVTFFIVLALLVGLGALVILVIKLFFVAVIGVVVVLALIFSGVIHLPEEQPHKALEYREQLQQEKSDRVKQLRDAEIFRRKQQ